MYVIISLLQNHNKKNTKQKKKKKKKTAEILRYHTNRSCRRND